MRSFLLLLLLCVYGGNAFVFTCDEVKEMIVSKTLITATNACVALDEYIKLTSGFATEVFIQDGTGTNQWSLVEVAKAGCVNSTVDSWKITTSREDEGRGIDCSYQFTVLFSSIESTIVTAGNEGLYHRSLTAGNITIVDPRGGILISFTCNDTQQTLDFYSGLGNGEREEMYYMGSSKCDDRFEMWALDTAITISIRDDGYVKMLHHGTGGYLSIGSVSYDMVVMGSGRASNLIQHGEDDKFLWLNSDYGVTFHIDGYYEMDERVGNDIVFTALCQNNPCRTQTVPLNESSVHLSIDADLLSFDYYTKVGDGENWRDNDSFFFRIISTPLATEAPTTVTPVKTSTDYSCGCELTNGSALFSSSLWLDVIFIVDVSQSMDSNNLLQASSLVESILTSLTLNDSNSISTFSRAGLVAASDTAEIILDLSSPFTTPINLAPSSAYEADIGNAISVAMNMFSRAANRSSPQLIYIITASDASSTPFKINFSQSKLLQSSVADSFKDNGGIIAVTEVDAAGSISSLRSLSSPGYYNLGFRNDVNLDLQMMCDANCFCPFSYSAFSDDSDERQTPSRGCYISQPIAAPFPQAKDHCSSIDSLLSTVHDDDKENFLLQVISQFGAKIPFWIGYEKNGDNWEWIDTSNSTYTKWSSGQPSQGNCAYAVQTTGFNSGWFSDDCSHERQFICEKAPCSVKKYCQ